MSGQRERTGGLWFLAIAALLFGLMGCCGGALGSWGLVNQQNQQAQMQAQGMDMEMFEAMQPDGLVMGIQYAALGVNGICAILLFVIAIFIFTWNPNTSSIGSILLGAVAVLTVIITALELYSSYVQMEKLAAVMGDMSGTSGGAGGAMMESVASMGFGVTLCITGGWQGSKILVALWGLFYLRKEQIAQLFGGGGNIGPRGDY